MRHLEGFLLVAPFLLTGLTLVALTAHGASRRGLRPTWAALAGLMLPVTWVVWYVHDRRSCSVRPA
ncbi:MAG TPA: hypothetical protein VF288_08030 [Mycobacteriales bacterium]